MIVCNMCKVIVDGEFSQMNLPKINQPAKSEKIWELVHLCPECGQKTNEFIYKAGK